MQKFVPDVETYIAESPEERKPALERLRALSREVLQGYTEEMEYGMPVYKRNGKTEIAFASQKQYISLYVLKKEVVDEHRGALAGCSIGKGCIRFKSPGKIDFQVVESLLRRSLAANSEAC